MFSKIKSVTELVRDLCLIIGVPTLIVLAYQLHSAEISILKAQIETLKDLQYDKAIAIIKAKDHSFDIEKELLQKSINILGGGEIDFDDFNSRYTCLRLNKDVTQ